MDAFANFQQKKISQRTDTMKSITKTPVNVSDELIRSFYYVEFDQRKDNNSGVVVDDACYELMFVKEKNVKIIDGESEALLLPPAYTLNNLKGPFKFEFSDTFSSFCIKLQPWMNASYVPTIRPQLLNLNKLYAEKTSQLHEQIFRSDSIEAMIDYAERFLLSLTIQPSKDIDLVKNICHLIYKQSGNITVTEIAEKFNIYRQKLNSIFKREVKYTLKTFINCVRIRSCLSYKLKHPDISLTEIGYLFGYYDQAHFIRSFKNACGVTPSEYVKNRGYSFWSYNEAYTPSR